MQASYDLERFVTAQDEAGTYDRAFAELPHSGLEIGWVEGPSPEKRPGHTARAQGRP